MGTDDASKLFIAGLPDGITEEALRALLADVGSEVERLSLPRDRTTGRPRGFAFVTLASPAQAEEALKRLDGALVAGRAITVRPFSSEPPGARGEHRTGGDAGQSRFQDASDRTLYVGNLPYDATEVDVRDLFAAARAVDPTRVHIPADPMGRPRGFGFATFATADDANSAILATRDAAVRGRRCVIHIAHKKGERPGPGDGGGRFGARVTPRPRGPDMGDAWLAMQGDGDRARSFDKGPATAGGGDSTRPPPVGERKRRVGESADRGAKPKPKSRGGHWEDDD